MVGVIQHNNRVAGSICSIGLPGAIGIPPIDTPTIVSLSIKSISPRFPVGGADSALRSR